MYLIRKVMGLIRLLNSDLSSSKIAMAGVIGLFWGMAPFFSPHNLLLLIFVVLLKIPINFALLGMVFFLPFSYLFASPINHLGQWILKSEGMAEIFGSLYNSFWILSKFNNTFIMGSFIIATVSAPPFYWILNFLIKTYRHTINKTLITSAIYQKFLKKTKVFDFLFNLEEEIKTLKTTGEGKPTKNKHGVLSWLNLKFFLPIVIIVALVVIGFKYFLDNTIKNLIAQEGTKYNQALVELRRFSSSLYQGRASVYDLQWTDNQNPDNNLFQFEEFTADTQFFPLLRGRFVFEELSLKDFRINTPRKKSGKLPDSHLSSTEDSNFKEDDSATEPEEPGLLDNFQKDFQDEFDKMLTEAKTEVQKQGDEITKKNREILDSYEKKVENLERKFDFQQDIENLKSIRVDQIKDLPTALSSAQKLGGIDKTIRKIDDASKDVDQLKKSLSKDLNQVKKQLNANQIKKDLENRTLGILGLSSLSLIGFSEKVFGPGIASYIDTYIEYYQKYKHLLWNKDADQAEEVTYDPAIRSGRDIRYPIKTPYPRFYIKRLIGTGNPEMDGVYHLDIENLSSNPSFAPIHNNLKLKYDVFNIAMNGELTLVDDIIDLSQEITTQPFPLNEVITLSPNILIQGIERGSAMVSGKIEDRNELITFTASMEIQDTLFTINPSLNQEIKLILENILASIDHLTFKIIFQKHEDNDPKLRIESDLDRLLERKLSSFSKNYLAQKKKDALRELEKAINPTLADIEEQLGGNFEKEMFKNLDEQINSVLKDVKNLDKTINRLKKEQEEKAINEAKKLIPKKIIQKLPKIKSPF